MAVVCSILQVSIWHIYTKSLGCLAHINISLFWYKYPNFHGGSLRYLRLTLPNKWKMNYLQSKLDCLTCCNFCTFPTCSHILIALSMDPGTAGLGLSLAAEGKFKAGEAASILGTTSAVIVVRYPFLVYRKVPKWCVFFSWEFLAECFSLPLGLGTLGLKLAELLAAT